MSNPKVYVDSKYLALVAALTQKIKQRSYELMQMQAGQTVLDVGCGPGTDTIPLAQFVGSTGRAVGIDYDPAMIAEADQRASSAGLSNLVIHRQGSALDLPFGEDEFDASRSERLFQHLLEPERALAEMIRVTRPGGWIVVADSDWGTQMLDSTEIEIERRLSHFRAEHLHNNGYSGRKLYRFFRRAGLQELTVEVFPIFTTSYAIGREAGRLDETEAAALAAGVVTQDELSHFERALQQADAADEFFTGISMIIVAGRKP